MATKEKSSEAVVGLFVLIGLIVLGALIVKFGRFNEGPKGGSYEVTLTLKDATGIIKGSEVTMAGAKIGIVKDTPVLRDDLLVEVELQLAERIKRDKNSIFQVESFSIIGDKMIVVRPPDEASRAGVILTDGMKVKGGGLSGFDAITSDAQSVTADARVLMKNARTTLLKMDASLDDIRAVAGRLSETIERVNTDLLDKENIENVKTSIANLKQTTEEFKNIGKKVNPTFDEVRDAIASIKQAADSADQAFQDASAQMKKLEPALAGVPEAVDSLRTAANKAGNAMDSAQRVMTKVENGDGLLKTLTDDKEFSGDTKTFMKNLKHYGILRYRNNENYNEKDPKDNRYRSPRRR